MILYFGCWGDVGHYLWAHDRNMLHYCAAAGPWTVRDLDATPYERTYRGEEVRDSGRGLVPVDREERQGIWRHTQRDGWTAIGAWDRTVDRRGGSKAIFVAEGMHTEEAMREMAAAAFPSVWARIAAGGDQ